MSPKPLGLLGATELLKALANPVRLAIVMELRESPHPVHDLVERLGVEQSLVSQHLRILRGARLVTASRRGREIVYSLVDEHVAHIAADAVMHAKEESTTTEIPRGEEEAHGRMQPA